MDTSRRGFLKLMGLTGAAAAVAGPSLFALDQPPTAALVGGAEHFVFDQGRGPILAPGASAHYLFPPDGRGPGYVVLMRDQSAFKSQWAKEKPDSPYEVGRFKPKRGWTPVGDPLSYQVNCSVTEGEDPHIAFFMAAAELQEKISRDAQELVKISLNRSLVFVTMVDSPIMAFPHEDRGFYLGAQISQFAVQKGDLTNADRAVSSRGEVPIEAPNDISFKYLMLMEGELRKMGMLDGNLHRVPRSAFRHAFQMARS